ncbi:RdgB/HAM1 family non-canonical purine NTP pyrophosphatase [Chloroflexota bacterium]
MTEKLLVATNNEGKLREYQNLLNGLPYELTTLAAEGIILEVDEVGSSLEENAELKATVYADRSGLLTLADDSGLEVDALDGAPGPLSARYAGEGASDPERITYLLSRLEGVPREKRTARFRCVIAVAETTGGVSLCEGECRGYVTIEPHGKQGFGYDPVFYLPEMDKTMAELPPETKNRISHRSRAAQKAYQLLLKRTKRAKK